MLDSIKISVSLPVVLYFLSMSYLFLHIYYPCGLFCPSPAFIFKQNFKVVGLLNNGVFFSFIMFTLELTNQFQMVLQLLSVFSICLIPTNYNIFHSADILTLNTFTTADIPTPFDVLSPTDNSASFSICSLSDFQSFQFSSTHLSFWFLSDSSATLSLYTLPNFTF